MSYQLAYAVKQFESGGDYGAMSPPSANGDRAYGAYQIMGNNVPAWTSQILGRSMTPDEFLNDKQAQDAVAVKKLGDYYTKYGNVNDAASAWFTGGPQKANAGKKDVLGTTTEKYVSSVKSIYDRSPNPLLKDFNTKVDQSRSKLGWSDTQILDYLAKKDPDVADKISKSRATFSSQTAPFHNDRDLVIWLSQKYTGSIPTIPSIPSRSVTRETTKQPGFLDQAAEAINGLYQGFTQLPGIKQFGQGVGAVTGELGGLIGTGVGAIGETGVQAWRAASGKGFDPYKILDVATQFGKEQEALTKPVGQAAAPASLLGGAGAVVNGLLAFGMGKSGYDELKQGIAEKDPVKAYEGAQNLLVAALGAKAGIEEIRSGKPGILLNPELKAQVKAEIDYLTERTPVNGAANEKAVAKAAETYRKVLQPTASEIKSIEIRKGQDINDVYRTMAEEKVMAGKDVGNTLDTKDAAFELRSKMDAPAAELGSLLESQPQHEFNLNDIRAKEIAEIEASNYSGDEKNARIRLVNRLIDAEAERYHKTVQYTDNSGSFGPVYRTKVEPIVDGPTLNKIKQGWWKMGYNLMEPSAHKVARSLGHAAKDAIEVAYKDPKIRALNKRIGQLAEASKLLENAHGRKIRGGVLGRSIAGLSGSIIGHSLGIPIIGPLAGHLGGNAVHEFMTDPERLITGAQKGIEKAAKREAVPVKPSLIEGTVERYRAGKFAEQATKLTIKNGGVTMNLKRNVPNSGFSFAPSKVTEHAVDIKDFNQDTVKEYLRNNAKALAQPGNHLGGWIDGGKVYLDVSRVVSDQAEAMAAAKDADQLAIYNINSGQSEFLKDYFPSSAEKPVVEEPPTMNAKILKSYKKPEPSPPQSGPRTMNEELLKKALTRKRSRSKVSTKASAQDVLDASLKKRSGKMKF